MYDLRTFGLADVLDCTSSLRHLGEGASSMEGSARSVVDFLYQELVDKQTDQRALSLVRLYKTHVYDELEPEVKAFADRMGGGPSLAGRACLTLLASAGDEPEWNDRKLSRQHQAIPLASTAALERSPMIAQLVRQLGLNPTDVVEPDPTLFRRNVGQACGVFFVGDAQGSPHVPAQDDFVVPYGIRSVLGFGGILPSGFVFAVVMFSKVEVQEATADSFATLAFSVQLALLPFVGGRLFESDPPDTAATDPGRDLTISRAQAAALGRLLDARQEVIINQSLRLEQAVRDAEDRADALARSQVALAHSEATKSAILDAALDGIVTMAADGRIIEFNPAAVLTFGYTREEAIGRTVRELLVPESLGDRHSAGLSRYLTTGEPTILGQRVEISARRKDGSEFPVELTVTEAIVGGAPVFSAHIRDITERLRAQAALLEAGERYARIARTLQASLLPPTLPVIPGVEVAFAYRPAGEGIDVGGDFYDVFQLGRGDWGIALGDVMGKGTAAAAVTALARYTLRAAATRTRRPTAALRSLNEAIHRHDTDRFCTVIYGRLRLGNSVRMTIASGGHPPALVRTASGVEVIEAPGMLLGPFSDWSGVDQVITLQPGDTVVFYSDGVSEARNGAELFGVERLAELLNSRPNLGAAGTVELIEQAVLDFSGLPHDDLAVVALSLAAL